MWALVLGTAIISTFVLSTTGLIDLDQTLYARLVWNPAASIVGGLIFGYGMAIAGNCGYGALARLGGGDLRSLVIIMVMGIAAYMAIGGPLASLRLALFPPEVADETTISTYTELAGAYGLPPIVVVLGISLPLLVWALQNTRFRKSFGLLGWSLAVSAAIVLGWVGTSYIAAESFDEIRIQSHTFTRPLGESMLFLMTSSATPLTFTLGSVTGVVLGALLGSISRGHFRWEACDDPHELGRQILGGALMGIGGVLALGCSIGQGLTAFSTLALSAPVVLLSIFIGATIGLRQLVQGFSFSAR